MPATMAQTEDVIPKIQYFNVKGKTNIFSKISRSPKDNQLNIKAEVSDLIINNQQLGKLELSSNGNTKLNTFNTELTLKKGRKKNIALNGVWQGLESPKLDFNILFKDLELNFLSPLRIFYMISCINRNVLSYIYSGYTIKFKF